MCIRDRSDTITLDLAGHALVTPEDYSLVLISNTFIVMSSQAGGELRGKGVYVAREKTAVFKENVKVTGMLSVTPVSYTHLCNEIYKRRHGGRRGMIAFL